MAGGQRRKTFCMFRERCLRGYFLIEGSDGRGGCVFSKEDWVIAALGGAASNGT